MRAIVEVFDARNTPTRKTPNQALEATRLRCAPQLERWALPNLLTQGELK
jgi:hypothetical protein